MAVLVAGGCAAACVLIRLPLMARRLLAWTVTWVAVLLGGLHLTMLLAVVDQPDPLASGSISGMATLALLAGMLLGVPVAALAREQPHGRAASAPPPAELHRASDASRWRSAPLTSRALIVVLSGVGLLLIVPGVAVGPTGDGAWLIILAVACLAPALAFARVRVVIDPDGLQVRGTGLRLLHIPIAEVARAEVVDHLDPFWEFGGWGLRVDVHGRTGLVSRAGPALRVVRGDDTEVLLTIDDTARAAATLNALADTHHAAG